MLPTVAQLNHEDLVFRAQLDLARVFVCGHSFGGATALTTVLRWQERGAGQGRDDGVRVCGVLVFDPAVDWMPDTERSTLLQAASHAVLPAPTMVVYSDEWEEKRFGAFEKMRALLQPMDEMQLSGSQDLIPHQLSVIPRTTHVCFSDTAFVLPLWLSRAFGLIGKQADPFALFAIQDMVVADWLRRVFP